MALSDATIRAAKPGEKLRKLSDGHGLQLHIFPNGSRLWRQAYRFDGKQKLLSLGSYPAISLADAREGSLAIHKQLKAGVDPSAARRTEKEAKEEIPRLKFGFIATEWLARREKEGLAGTTRAKTEWLLSFALPTLAQRPIKDIKAKEVYAVLKALEDRDRLESARRLRSVIGSIYKFAIATDRAETDITFGLRGSTAAPKATHRAAIIDREPFGALLRKIDAYAGQPSTRALLQFLALTAARPGEARAAEWSEIDLEKAVWNIPASRAKMRRPHAVPLSPQALAVIEWIRPISGRGRFIFPGSGQGARGKRSVEPKPVSEGTMVAALRRMGYSRAEASAHGFRTSFSSIANESGMFMPDVIERALSHKDKDAVRGAYARSEHWPERVRLMKWWCDQCDQMREGGKEIQIVGRTA